MSDQAAQEIRDGFPFLGGRLWLDFLNSAPATMGELIKSPEDLARWARAAGIDRAGRPAFTRDDVAAAHALRNTLGAIARALGGGAAPPARAVAEVNRHLAEAPRLRRVESAKGAVQVRETIDSDLFGSVASDLADFIPAFEPHRLRTCGGEDCSLMFYDSARNATRRWCSMAACGNRHKVARHRARGG
jgi:predicted RNA-binding Zn ribbon-like protein